MTINLTELHSTRQACQAIEALFQASYDSWCDEEGYLIRPRTHDDLLRTLHSLRQSLDHMLAKEPRLRIPSDPKPLDVESIGWAGHGFKV